MTINYKPFDGVGQVAVHPMQYVSLLKDYPGKPVSVRKSAARSVIDSFLMSGEHYSSTGGTLWIVMVWCHHHNVEFTLLLGPFGGVALKRKMS